MTLNAKRIAAGILLIVVVVMIVYPPLSTGTISLKFAEKGVGSADHLFITLGGISVHEAGADNQTRWHSILKQTITVDLMDPESLANSVVKDTIRTGWYDMISLDIASATLITGSNETSLALSTDQYVTNLSFVVKTGAESRVTVQFNFNVADIIRTGTLSLAVQASSSM